MGNKLLINGELFIGRTEIQSFSTEQQQGGIKVDWGNGDIDILTGQTWVVDDDGATTAVIVRYQGYSNGRFYSVVDWAKSTGDPRTNAQARFNFSQNCLQEVYPPFPERPSGNPPVPFNNFGWTATALNSRQAYCPSNRTKYGGFANVFQFSGDTGTINRDFGSAALIKTGPFSWGRVSVNPSTTTWTVTSNTGDISQRTQALAPFVSSFGSDDCILTIAYTDGKTQTLTYPECPTVAPYEEPDCPLPCALANQVISALRG